MAPAHVNHAPAPLQQFTPRPGRALISSMLAKPPARRPRDAESLARAVDAIRAGNIRAAEAAVPGMLAFGAGADVATAAVPRQDTQATRAVPATTTSALPTVAAPAAAGAAAGLAASRDWSEEDVDAVEPDRPYRPEEENRRSPWLLPLIVLLLLALAAIAFLILQPLLAGDDPETVPVETSTSASATPSRSRTPAPSPSTTSASPSPSPSTTEAEEVVITPSQYLGRPEAEVAAELGALGFRVETRREPSADIAAGYVIGVDPVGSLSPGETITVTSSSGPEQVTVPAGLQGRDAAEVEGILVDLGLVPVNTGTQESQQPPGTVLLVNPGAGTVLPTGSNVGYVVSTGPPAPPAPASTSPAAPTAPASPTPSSTATTGP